MPDIFAAVTINNVCSLNYLSGQTAHAKRIGPGIELRPGAVPCTQMLWSIHNDDPLLSGKKRRKGVIRSLE